MSFQNGETQLSEEPSKLRQELQVLQVRLQDFMHSTPDPLHDGDPLSDLTLSTQGPDLVSEVLGGKAVKRETTSDPTATCHTLDADSARLNSPPHIPINAAHPADASSSLAVIQSAPQPSKHFSNIKQLFDEYKLLSCHLVDVNTRYCSLTESVIAFKTEKGLCLDTERALMLRLSLHLALPATEQYSWQGSSTLLDVRETLETEMHAEQQLLQSVEAARLKAKKKEIENRFLMQTQQQRLFEERLCLMKQRSESACDERVKEAIFQNILEMEAHVQRLTHIIEHLVSSSSGELQKQNRGSSCL